MRRARPITRDKLVIRLARLRNISFPIAWDATKHLTIDRLRDLVELEESETARPGRHASEQWTGGLTR